MTAPWNRPALTDEQVDTFVDSLIGNMAPGLQRDLAEADLRGQFNYQNNVNSVFASMFGDDDSDEEGSLARIFEIADAISQAEAATPSYRSVPLPECPTCGSGPDDLCKTYVKRNADGSFVADPQRTGVSQAGHKARGIAPATYRYRLWSRCGR